MNISNPITRARMAIPGAAEAVKDRPMIERLFDRQREEFIGTYLGQRPLASSGTVDQSVLARLPQFDDIPGLVPLVAEHGSSLRFGRAGDLSASPVRRFPDGRLDMESLWSAYYEGATIVLNSLHKVDKGSRWACERLLFELGHRLQANAYLTPSSASAFPTHYDTHDVIVVQLSGTKTWHLYDPEDAVPALPLRSDLRATSDRLERGAHREIELTPGSALYLPRGIPHRAETRSDASLHISFGMVPVTGAELLKAAIDILEDTEVGLRRHVTPDIFKDASARVDLMALLDMVGERLSSSAIAAKALERVRKQALKDAQLTPPALFDLAGCLPGRVRWRTEVFSEAVQMSDGDLMITNGIKATRLVGLEIEKFRWLVAADVHGVEMDGSDAALLALVRRLSALGLVESAKLQPE